MNDHHVGEGSRGGESCIWQLWFERSTDGSKDGFAGKSGDFWDILWSGQRRESIEMMYNEQQGRGVRYLCTAEVRGSNPLFSIGYQHRV
jgi:hypothetical protein